MEEISKEEICKKFRIYMAENNLNQLRLSQALGLTPSYISLILSGKREPSNRLCKLIGLRRSVKKITVYEALK